MRLLAVWITALLAATGLAACSAPVIHSEGAARLAQDLARAGIVPGEPLPSDLQLTNNDSVVGWGGPNSSGYACANGGFMVDSKGKVKKAVLHDPKAFPSHLGLSAINVKTSSNEELWGLPQEAVTKLYGEPSLMYVADSNRAPVMTYMYYFRKNRKTCVSIALGFPEASGKLFNIRAMAITEQEARESEILCGKYKIYAWPRGI